MKLIKSILTAVYAVLEYSLTGSSELLKQANDAPMCGSNG